MFSKALMNGFARLSAQTRAAYVYIINCKNPLSPLRGSVANRFSYFHAACLLSFPYAVLSAGKCIGCSPQTRVEICDRQPFDPKFPFAAVETVPRPIAVFEAGKGVTIAIDSLSSPYIPTRKLCSRCLVIDLQL